MKYYTFIDPGEDGETIYHTLSEEAILEDYWEYWYGKLCDKYGEEYVNKNYSQKDCIEDWVVVNWAWESTK